jgi:hypothetical protein
VPTAAALLALAFASVPRPTKPNEATNSIDINSFLILFPLSLKSDCQPYTCKLNTTAGRKISSKTFVTEMNTLLNSLELTCKTELQSIDAYDNCIYRFGPRFPIWAANVASG